MSSQNRVRWADYARAIGIVLVVYGHTARGVINAGLVAREHRQAFELVDSVIYSFHMPLFFFLSGLFFLGTLRSRGASRTAASKVEILVYPYFVWSLIEGCVEIVARNHTNRLMTVDDLLMIWWRPIDHFWFLYALFYCSLAATAIYGCIRSRTASTIVLATAAAANVHAEVAASIVPLHFVLLYFFYFAAGIWYSQHRELMEPYTRRHPVALAGLFVVAQWLFHGPAGLRFDDRGWAGLALAVVSIAFVVSLSQTIRDDRAGWLRVLGAASMSIYLMHVLLGSGMRIVLTKVFAVHDVALHLLLGSLSGIGLSLLFDRLIVNRRAGWLLRPPRIVLRR